ncbi:hypothetical protein NDA01_18495 [Trichocoleus desertorum AS-A10]|uniref:hypothetical protein n=1 Tax=Trichocoleus desertorum TaxID=1481672 RepID=UPI00329A131E
MNETANSPNLEKIASLEQQNAELRQELKTLTEEIYPYRLYVEARNKLSGLMVGLVTVVGLFGFVSVQALVQEIEQHIKEKEIQNISRDVKDGLIVNEDFREKISTDTREAIKQEVLRDQVFKDRIAKEVITSLNQDQAFQDKIAKATIDNPRIQSLIEESVRASLLPVATKAQQAATTESGSQFAQALTQSYEDKRYFVIAASSLRAKDVQNELSRVQKLVGESFNQQFPNARTCVPKASNSRHALVVGSNLSFSEAEALKKKAIANKFQSDTYVLPANKIFFNCS